jgi:hypothetical protein
VTRDSQAPAHEDLAVRQSTVPPRRLTAVDSQAPGRQQADFQDLASWPSQLTLLPDRAEEVTSMLRKRPIFKISPYVSRPACHDD